GVDVAVETTGNVRAIEQAYEGTAAQGRTVLVGVPRKGEKVSLYTLPLHFKKVLTGSEGGGCRPEVDIPKLVRLCRTGRLNLQDLVGRRYPLERINQAIAELRSGKVAGRCIVQMDASAHRVAAP
ncbi:MAG TPA: zinc-binding dehydrogenase, partial [Polyangia bacterium]|nr:zinc-binding dehydrogenase [Polyangia bacterium]